MAIRTWNWNNFKGGLADNANIGPEGSFQNGSYGIDITSEPNGVKLASDIKLSFTTTGEPVTQFYYNGNHYVFCSDKAIYLNGVLKWAYNSTPATTMGVIYGVNVMNIAGTDYLYLLGVSAIHKSTTDLTTLTYTVASFTSYATLKPSIIYGNDMYFTSKNIFYKYSSAEVLTTLYTGNLLNIFTGLTFFQDTFNLYSNYNYSQSGKQFIIGIADLTEPIYIVNWNNLPIIGVTNVGGFDYVVAGITGRDLYLVSGTQRKIIKSNLNGNGSTRDFNGVILSYLDDVYLLSNNSGLLRYGLEYVGLPIGLSPLGIVSNKTFSTIIQGGNNLYIGGYGGGAYGVYTFELNNPPTFANYYVSVGEVISLVQDFGNPYIEKSLLQIDIAYDCDNSAPIIPHGGTITLYARKDSSDSWTQIYTGTPTSGIGKVRIIGPQITALGFGDFYQCEFKIKLEPKLSGANNYYTPLIKGILITYEDGIKI